MSSELIVVLMLLAAAIAMFAINKPRMDAVALLMLTALPFTGAVTMSEALAGFSDPNIVLIAALFVTGEGLVRTGVARQLGDWLAAQAGTSETRLIILLMVAVCGLGAAMSSTAVTAIFIPVVLRIANQTGASASQLMMPLSSAALISGMTTLVATAPNLVVNSELMHYLERTGAEDTAGFHFFSFTPFGVPVLILGVVYMLFARRWLPAEEKLPSGAARNPTLSDWIEDYQLAGREHRVRVLPGSPLISLELEEVSFENAAGTKAIAIEREGKLVQPTANLRLQQGDVLLLDMSQPGLSESVQWSQHGLESLPLGGGYFNDLTQEIGMAEVLLPPDSTLVGKSPVESKLRERTGLTVIGLRRGSEALPGGGAAEKLKFGDTLLVVGTWRAIRNASSSSAHLIVLNVPAEMAEVLPAPGKAPQALFCLALVVGLMITGLVPNVQAALIGCLLLGWLGCIDLPSAYRAIDWKTVVLIVGMLPFSIALQRTGGVELASEGLMRLTQGMGPHGMLAALFCLTAILGMFISNTATAVLMAPVAIAMAEAMDASPYPFAMIVALATSTAFMTPVSSPVNTLVVTPGNYTFFDFVRVGAPFSILVMIVCVVMVPLLLPL